MSSIKKKLEIAFVRSTLMRLSVFGLRSLKILLLPHVLMLKDIQLVSLQNFLDVVLGLNLRKFLLLSLVVKKVGLVMMLYPLILRALELVLS